MRKKKRDIEGEILAKRWDTESTTSDKMRALRGTWVTDWCDNWLDVLAEVESMELKMNMAAMPNEKS